ncbi:MAG: protoporphyrinogen oxidase [Ignavibacteriaceae bacterium]|nr:protoporphyrinogen oxidase [Ignavibacteriaceae bacterium]
MSKKVVILGAGVSGLATALWLYKKDVDVTVLEKNSDAGGAMESIFENGYMFDRGPNSGLETTEFVRELAEAAGLKDEMVYANPAGNKRYILRNGELHALPMSPPGLIKTKLFSASAKFRLFGEPFIGRSKDGYYQSVAQFVKRRLGEEFLDYAINPFVSGVYAGRPEDLSVRSAFPKLYELEEKYGGLIVGTIRSIRERKKRKEKSKQSAKMFSFTRGMQSFPKAIAAKLGERVITLADVTSVVKEGEKYKVTYNNAGSEKHIVCDVVISTLPAYVASKLFSPMDPELANHLDAIYYPPVMVVYLGFNKNAVGRELDGFGFLIPEKEEKSFLGAIWSSVLFPARAPEDTASFTLFIGGSRNASLFNEDKGLVAERAISEFMEIMKIIEEPVYKSMRFWNKAIPQYNIGYIEHERYADEFEKNNKGIILSGNFRGGISVGDCIKNSDLVAKKASELV